MCAAMMLGSGKNVWQAEIDAAVEIIDFWYVCRSLRSSIIHHPSSIIHHPSSIIHLRVACYFERSDLHWH
jgi:hypothetical protein